MKVSNRWPREAAIKSKLAHALGLGKEIVKGESAASS